MNLAFSSSPGKAGASTGVYDLSDPLSALQFGHFIIGLSGHFQIIEQCISDCRTRDMCWRLDHVQLTETQDPHIESQPLDLHARIQAWMGDINWPEASRCIFLIPYHSLSVLVNLSASLVLHSSNLNQPCPKRDQRLPPERKPFQS